MSNSTTKFQQLLRELFQFDCADLDFGIYRIMNYKQAVIERFISQDLPQAIADELAQGALAEQAQAAKDLQAVRQKVLEALGEDALDAEGNLAAQYQNTKAGKEYLAARERAKAAKGSEALEAAVYNHLYTFFSRYWQDGDFITKRRYSKKERYAIPYNGEEVYLYWANHDQYYIKTGEYFTDYTWRAPNGVTVHFKLKAADVEQNNVKGEKRFFLPLTDEVTWDAENPTITIPFHFRPLTAQESITYGQNKQQELIIAKALEVIPTKLSGQAMAEARIAVLTEKRRADGSTISLLEHHLRQYTRRNTSDFFIHKDLRGFLSRELDFYLKNEVLNLDELEAAGEGLTEGWFQLLRLIKRVGGHIIAFLAQIEDFQKMLWEKKKFVTETFYVITVGNIPVSFYPEIAACEAQWEEWEKLMAVEAQTLEGRIPLLKAHPSLPLDTRHFSSDFVDRLLASFDNLDEMTDGLLVHSENWQALNLLQETYRERVQCVYIDPPYNTGSDEFLYRDAYQHSSWLAMLVDRLHVAITWLNNYGTLFVSVDDNELRHLRTSMDTLLGESNVIATIPVIMNLKGNQDEFGFAGTHEYALVAAKEKSSAVFGEFQVGEEEMEEWEQDEYGYFKRGANLKATGVNAPRKKRPNLFYPIYVSPDNNVSLERTTSKDVELLPITNGQEMSWRWSSARVRRESHNIIVIRDGDSIALYKKQRPSLEDLPTKKPKSVFYKPEYSSGNGTAQIKSLFGSKVYTNPKPANLIMDYLIAGGCNSIALDFFAGSGTTGHAVINLNREDGGRRKFILVEMAHYFDTVLLPRVKKATFTPEWKDGKPRRMATPEEAERGPRIVKVIRLESYEDALNNIAFDESSGQMALQLEDYLLHYMLKWEARHSETLLNVEKLQKPFAYKLHIHCDAVTRSQPVDLPETFNYLIGLNVETRQVFDGEGRRYLVYRGTTREGRRVAVIWRETAGWTEKDYRRDRDFIADNHLTDGADEIFVNGDSLIPGARALESVFTARLFAGVEA